MEQEETQCRDNQMRFGNPLVARVMSFAWRGVLVDFCCFLFSGFFFSVIHSILYSHYSQPQFIRAIIQIVSITLYVYICSHSR